MCSSSSILTRLVVVPVLAIQLLLIRNVSSLNMTNAYLHHKCYVNQGKYKPGSVYEKNLKSIIHSISSSTRDFRQGYEMRSLTEGPDFVSLTLQCRADSYGPKCRSCYATALSELRKRCPRYKGGIIWFEHCLLETSGIESLWKIDYDNNFCMTNAKDVSGDKDSFNMKWEVLLDNLTSIAIDEKNLDGNHAAGYAVGETTLGTKKLYGMVQCTKDLSGKGCQACVAYISLHFQNCWLGKQGARVLGRSCNIRYELYPFVNTNSTHKFLKI